MMAQTALLIIYQRRLLAIAFLVLRLVWVAGWLRQTLQAQVQANLKWKKVMETENFLRQP
jgi:hypothetical protein